MRLRKLTTRTLVLPLSSFYLAPSLVVLRNEINKAYPHRDHRSDGWIGDASHAARKSDHNPDYSTNGVVRAIDVDKDGIDPNALVRLLIKDPRVAYVIWNTYIWSRKYGFRRRHYTGESPHKDHVHVSILHGAAYENNRHPWGYAPARKTVHQIAQEVIDGKWGNGDTRVHRLTAAGYNPREVQAEVNRILS